MIHQWALTGIELTDPTYVYIDVDDDGLVTAVSPPVYRTGDIVIKTLIANWELYEPEGSPAPAKDIIQFNEFIIAAYGTETYVLRQLR